MTDLLAHQTSDTVQGLDGKPLPKSWLALTGSGILWGPLHARCACHTETLNHPLPSVESFYFHHFHHADRGSINIMVSAGDEIMG